MDVAIVGAAGDCGRQIAARLAGERLLFPTDRLQLVGRRGGESARVLPGLAVDLVDASAETAPAIDVALDPEDIVADIIIMTAGASTPRAPRNGPIHRDDIARVNLPVFREVASAIARNGTGREVVLVVTNPVELGVEVFARALGRHRVIGIGAYSDTLRFRREIAAELGVRRQLVRGFFLGEHGDHGVPIWSSVHMHGWGRTEREAVLPRLRTGASLEEFAERLAVAKREVLDRLMQGDFPGAISCCERLRPDLRVHVKPYITQLCGAKTAQVTAGVVVDLVRTLLEGREVVVAGQVALAGEFLGIEGVTGMPLTVGATGWTRVVPLDLLPDEEHHLRRGADTVRAKIEGWLHHA